MGSLNAGDRLVVSQLSRLGRSLGEVVNLLDAIAKASVAFVAVKENIRFERRQDLQTKVMTTLFALFAEVERDLISERTREGLGQSTGVGQETRSAEGIVGRLAARRLDLIDFLDTWDGEAALLIHCLAGVSRSTAAALIAHVLKTGDPRKSATALRKASPYAWPNRRSWRWPTPSSTWMAN